MSQVLRQLRAEQSSMGRRPRLMERFADFLPVTADTPPLGLGEGFTPLVHARNLGRAMGVPLLHLKVEGQNPTGSFKDRGMVVAVAKAMEAGARAVICASTGNTSSSAAAYGAGAGLEAVIVLPTGKIAAGKLLQAQAAGARVVAVDGNFDDALRVVREMTAERDPGPPGDARELGQPVPPRGPEDGRLRDLRGPRWRARLPRHPGRQRRQHQRLLAGLQGVPRRRAWWRRRPRMLGFQAEGAAPLVLGHDVDDPQTFATAIRIGDPPAATGARCARRIGRPHRRGHRRGDLGGLSRPRPLRGHLLRAGERGLRGRRAQGCARRAHRPRQPPSWRC